MLALSREPARSMKIYGDSNSGNCLKVKWVCDRLALPYSWIAVDTMKRETRTPQFLALNSAGQVPAVELDDGRTLAQSNAIIRYLARGSDLIPADPFAAAKMDEWLFWEQYSHEPYVAVCRFQMVYLGKPASELDPDKVKRGYAALARMERHLAATRFLVGDGSRSPTSRCSPIRGSRMKAASTSTVTPRCGAGSPRPNAAWPVAGALTTGSIMTAASSIAIRRARRDDVPAIVAMLADDPLGSARERLEDPLPRPILRPSSGSIAIRRSGSSSPTSEGASSAAAALHAAGTELAGRLARPDRGRARRVRLPQPRHRRAAGAVGGRGSARQRLQAGRTADASHPRRCAALL